METLRPSPERPGPQVTDDIDGLSLYQRARRYPRSRIIVEPLLWTKLQLDLLQCAFAGPCPCPAPPVIMKIDNPAAKLMYEDFAWSFNRHRPRDRPDAMLSILCAFGGLLESLDMDSLYFSFGPRDKRLPCLVFRLRAENCPVPIVAAHVDHKLLVGLRRRNIIDRCAGRRRHEPGLTLGKLILKKFETDEPLHEPYIVALLIAVAQAQWRFIVRTGQESRASGVKPRVFFTTNDKESIYLYSANVSSVFISMLKNPQVSPTAPQPLHIQITKIPCEPLDTLRNRIYALLFSAATTPHDVSTLADVVKYI